MQSNLVLSASFIPDPQVLRIKVVGNGAVPTVLTSNVLIYGRSYQLVAKPAAGNLFGGWTLSGVPASVKTNSTTLVFNMGPNVIAQANFYTNYYMGLKGDYNGLFHGDVVSMRDAGFIHFSLSSQGVANGSLLTPAGNYSFTATFDRVGGLTTYVKRPGTSPLLLTLQLDCENGTDLLTGSVADGANWVSTIQGDRVVFNSSHVNPGAGTYTMALVSDEFGPQGDSYATLTLSRSGVVSVIGKLGDNQSFSQSAPLSKNGMWPLYVNLSSKEMLFGWVSFNTANDYSDMSGAVAWIKRPAVSGLYKAGFTNTATLIGSSYGVPVAHTSGLTMRSPVVTHTGGNLSDQSFDMNVDASKLVFMSANKTVSLTIKPSSGTFVGKIISPTGKVTTANGVLLQTQNSARGYFLGTNSSGQFLLENKD